MLIKGEIMSFPNVVKSIYSMDNSDINVVGEYLGYDWNEICDEISSEGFYGQDGTGCFYISRSSKNEYADSKILNEIFVEIFKHNPTVNEITVIDES